MVAVRVPSMRSIDDLLRALESERSSFAASNVMDRAREVIPELIAEIDRLRAANARLLAALESEPFLTPEQEAQLTGVTFSAILPRLEIFKLGWRMAMRHARAANTLGQSELQSAETKPAAEQ